MNSFTFLLALAIFGGAADAKSLRAAYTASSSSEDIPVISSTRKLQSSSEDIPTISSSRKLQSSSEDVPTISSSRKLQSSSEDIPTISSSRKLQSSSEDIPTISSSRMLDTLTQAEMDSCYAIIDSTAVDDAINKDSYVEFLNLLAFGYLTENDVTTFDDLSQPLQFAWNTLTCQCKKMGGDDNCCEADRAKLSVEGADGTPVSEAQTNFLNDICKTAIGTLGSEGWENSPPGEMPKPDIEQELPANPTPETLTPGQIIGMSVGIPLLIVVLAITLYFCRREKTNKLEEGEEDDDELADVEKDVSNDDDTAIGTVLTAGTSTVVGSQSYA